ncbi:KinB-signaling pathway activation protein [Neobacillus notoginsengisoli]|uniref:KinB-signaling pathway activation protein n=1 Tax=Neobacillus notoginsengisoli TaxID=1578198 RepID=A0A417YKU0_9BACI|nr:KinB-signaling pathway activation protein [Neobacillus notoginsengisoli]RHW33944.1 KinB-signaling pathway activation protein [Neobacillus notoginsengisoli]
MTSRNWVKLFINTLMLGAITTAITGFIVRWGEFSPLFSKLDIVEILSVLFWLVGIGFIFSLLSQMGFFAYLTVHRFGLGIFKSAKLWNSVQTVIVAFVLFDLIYLRYTAFAKEGEGLLPYFVPALIVLGAGLLVAWRKMSLTNKEAFIPALFFMVVGTVLEWVPILRVNEGSWFYLMLVPLLVCNAYQILVLHKLNEKSLEERKRLQERSKPVVETSAKKKKRNKPSR